MLTGDVQQRTIGKKSCMWRDQVRKERKDIQKKAEKEWTSDTGKVRVRKTVEKNGICFVIR
jgi:hypothetical protein